MVVTHFLNKIDEVTPVAKRGIAIELNYDPDALTDSGQLKPYLNISNLRFVREDIAKIKALIDAGINGTGPGITEGVPYDIELMNGITGEKFTLNLYLDLLDGLRKSKEGMITGIKQYKGLDWFDEQSRGMSFESMYENGFATEFQNKFVHVPYVLSTVPNYREAFMALFMAVMIGIELVRVIKDIIAGILDIFHWIDYVHLVACIIKLILLIIYAIGLIITLTNLIADFVLNIIQPPKYLTGMLVVDMLGMACEKMGLQFESETWKTYPYNQLAILPEKFNLPDNADQNFNVIGSLHDPIKNFKEKYDGLKGASKVLALIANPAFVGATLLATNSNNGFLNTLINNKLKGHLIPPDYVANPNDTRRGYTNGTLYDLFILAKKLCNGKFTIKNGKLYLNRRDWNLSTENYILPAVRRDWVGYNSEDFFATFILRFLTDHNDKNTVDKYRGTILQATQTPLIVNDKSLVLTKSLKEITIELARGINKTDLTVPEQMMFVIVGLLNHYNGFMRTMVGIQEVVTVVSSIILAPFVFSVILAINLTIATVNAILFSVVPTIILALETIKAIMQLIDDFGINLDDEIADLQVKIDELYSFINGGLIQFIPFPDLTDIFDLLPDTSDLADLPPPSFTNRFDMLLMENDYNQIPKLVLLDTANPLPIHPRAFKLHPDNLNVVNAERFFREFYSIEMFVPNIKGVPNSAGEHNQMTIIRPALNSPEETNKISFTFAEFKKVLDNNKIFDDGDSATLDSLFWNFEDGWIEIQYRKKEIYTNNLELKISIPNGD